MAMKKTFVVFNTSSKSVKPVLVTDDLKEAEKLIIENEKMAYVEMTRHTSGRNKG